MAGAIAYRNYVDEGVVVASSQVLKTPVALVQNPHIARVWRSAAVTSAYLVADLGAPRSVDVVAAFGLNLTAAGSVRVRLSSADTSGAAGDVWDSGTLSGIVDYSAAIVILPAATMARYVRIDLSDPGLPYIEAGRFVASLLNRFTFNFAKGWGRGWVDRSKKTEGPGGQTFIDTDNSYRTLDLQFNEITEAERNSFVEIIDRVNGEHIDVLVITDTASANLPRDSVWGLLDGNSSVTKTAFNVFAKSYKIKERL